MAATVDLNNIEEHFDDPETFTLKVEALAKLIAQSKHLVLFTGAGISTAAKIPDFRGPNGVWTNRAKGVPPPRCIRLKSAQPTECHQLISTLVEQGKVKYVVSQNVDGLHRRSGVPKAAISELHGNSFIAVCWQCGHDAPSDDEVHGGLHKPKTCKECHPRTPHFCHCTGAACPKCGAMLKDSIIHFGESLPSEALELANQHASQADLCIVLGSSLTVSPANEIPVRTLKRGGKVVVVNLQKTHLDDRCALRIWGNLEAMATKLRTLLLEDDAGSEEWPATPATIPFDAVPARSPLAVLPGNQHEAVLPRANPARGPLTVLIGNQHEVVPPRENPDNIHRWKMFVDAPPSALVTEVVYRLHPTFSPSEVALQRSAANPKFELSRVGWGTFAVGVTLRLADGRALSHRHELDFTRPVSAASVTVC